MMTKNLSIGSMLRILAGCRGQLNAICCNKDQLKHTGESFPEELQIARDKVLAARRLLAESDDLIRSYYKTKPRTCP